MRLNIADLTEKFDRLVAQLHPLAKVEQVATAIPINWAEDLQELVWQRAIEREFGQGVRLPEGIIRIGIVTFSDDWRSSGRWDDHDAPWREIARECGLRPWSDKEWRLYLKAWHGMDGDHQTRLRAIKPMMRCLNS
ncbi:MAG: hypothetical protein ACFCUR_20965 [Rhodomicrobiaceae bacterium]